MTVARAISRLAPPGRARAVLAAVDAAIMAAQRDLHLSRVPEALTKPKGLISGEWRSVMEVLDVAILAVDFALDGIPGQRLVDLVHTLTAWYFLASKPCQIGDDLDQLGDLCRRLHESFAYFTQWFGRRLFCPKVHRATHIVHSIQEYGPYDCLTSEMGEAAHKQFKRMFRRCASRCVSCFVGVGFGVRIPSCLV